MDLIDIDKIHCQTLLNIYKIDDSRIKCIFQSYPSVKIAILEDNSELKSLTEKVKESSDTFYIYVFSKEHYSKYVEQFEHNGESQILANILKLLTERSYFFYTLVFNKGIQKYILHDTEFKMALVKLLYRVSLILAKKSMISINLDNAKEILTAISAFIAYCIFGLHSLKSVIEFTKGLNIGFTTRTKVILFWKHFANLCDEGKNLAQVLASLQDWPKISIDSFYINSAKLLGPTLTNALFTCDNNDIEMALPYKISYLFTLFKTGLIYQETNVASVNRISDFALRTISKKLDKYSKLGHFGKC